MDSKEIKDLKLLEKTLHQKICKTFNCDNCILQTDTHGCQLVRLLEIIEDEEGE